MKNTRLGILLGAGILLSGIALTGDSASARPSGNRDRDDRRDNREARKDVKEARKEVKEARKDLREADERGEREEARRDLREAQRDLREERRELRNERRDNFRPGWNTSRPGWNNGYRPPVTYRPPVSRPSYGNAYGYYGRPGNRYGQIYGRTNSWNNGWRTVEGIVTRLDRGENDFYIRLRDGKTLRIKALNGVPSRLNNGDFVRVMGTYPSQTLRAERIDILQNR